VKKKGGGGGEDDESKGESIIQHDIISNVSLTTPTAS